MIIVRIILALIVFVIGTVIGGFLCNIPLGWVLGIPAFVGGIILAGGIIASGAKDGPTIPYEKQESRWDNI